MRDVLCLDLGTVTGYALHEDGYLDHGIHKFSKDLGERLCQFHDWLSDQTPQLVYYEKPFNVPGRAALTLNAMAGIVEKVGHEKGWVVHSVSPMTIKKAVTGTGRATKKDMVEHIQKRFPEVRDHNEADALGIWLWYGKLEEA